MACGLLDVSCMFNACGINPVCMLGEVLKSFWGITTLYVGLFFSGLMVAVVIVIAYALNQIFGVNIGDILINTISYLLIVFKDLLLWIPANFKYNRKEEIFALAIICFVLFIFLLMAFNLNETGVAGGISIGSDSVRSSSSGEGSLSGTGIDVGVDAGVYSAVTTLPTTVSSVTTTTYPEHCMNFVTDEEENDIDCDGGCIPCDCFLNGNRLSRRICGSNCPDKCDCNSNSMCFSQYCCPLTLGNATCRGKCVDAGLVEDYVVENEAEGLGLCETGTCILDANASTQLVFTYPKNNYNVSSNGVFSWY